jgi:hypothetical protein
MSDYRLEPREQPAPKAEPEPTPVASLEEYHCANCLWIGFEDDGFWACQNLCIREP